MSEFKVGDRVEWRTERDPKWRPGEILGQQWAINPMGWSPHDTVTVNAHNVRPAPRMYGIYCLTDGAFCQGEPMTAEQAIAALPKWVSGKAADVDPDKFRYEIREMSLPKSGLRPQEHEDKESGLEEFEEQLISLENELMPGSVTLSRPAVASGSNDRMWLASGRLVEVDALATGYGKTVEEAVGDLIRSVRERKKHKEKPAPQIPGRPMREEGVTEAARQDLAEKGYKVSLAVGDAVKYVGPHGNLTSHEGRVVTARHSEADVLWKSGVISTHQFSELASLTKDDFKKGDMVVHTTRADLGYGTVVVIQNYESPGPIAVRWSGNNRQWPHYPYQLRKVGAVVLQQERKDNEAFTGVDLGPSIATAKSSTTLAEGDTVKYVDPEGNPFHTGEVITVRHMVADVRWKSGVISTHPFSELMKMYFFNLGDKVRHKTLGTTGRVSYIDHVEMKIGVKWDGNSSESTHNIKELDFLPPRKGDDLIPPEVLGEAKRLAYLVAHSWESLSPFRRNQFIKAAAVLLKERKDNEELRRREEKARIEAEEKLAQLEKSAKAYKAKSEEDYRVLLTDYVDMRKAYEKEAATNKETNQALMNREREMGVLLRDMGVLKEDLQGVRSLIEGERVWSTKLGAAVLSALQILGEPAGDTDPLNERIVRRASAVSSHLKELQAKPDGWHEAVHLAPKTSEGIVLSNVVCGVCRDRSCLNSAHRTKHPSGRPHINYEGEFQSDKYPTCPAGKVPLSVKDKSAQPLLWVYAQLHRGVDAQFSDDLEWALKQAGYKGEGSHTAKTPLFTMAGDIRGLKSQDDVCGGKSFNYIDLHIVAPWDTTKVAASVDCSLTKPQYEALSELFKRRGPRGSIILMAYEAPDQE